VAAVALGLALFRAGTAPGIEIESAQPGIGRKAAVTVKVEATGRGLGDVLVELIQGERRTVLAERSYESQAPWEFWGSRDTVDAFSIDVGSDALGEVLQEGSAIIRVKARPPGAWLRKAEPAVLEREFDVLLRPPALGIFSTQHYPAQGGCELVVYSVGETSIRDGVTVAESWFPGFPLPGAPAGQKFVLFAVPFDLESTDSIHLTAEDAVGNRAEMSFVDRLQTRAYDQDQIDVSRGFMSKVVPEIVANSPSVRESDDLLNTYLSINRDLRARNATELFGLAAKSRTEFLWTESFLGLPNAKVMSSFADRRTYVFEGRPVDQQDHLGFDLASVKRAPVPASNRGVVVLARYFGIYGNAVIVDHGYGLMSLYGHLSTLEVEVGQEVEKGQLLGRTGETGLAGGDHLHFTMLLQGRAVNPVEWWDETWIKNRLKKKLGAASSRADF
jgi:murein DD-endopeptidase MepM/ murein hydrolase activator NlpD